MTEINITEMKRVKNKSNELKSALHNVTQLCIILVVPEAKYIGIHGKGIKIITPKHILQRLVMDLAHVKTGNTSY